MWEGHFENVSKKIDIKIRLYIYIFIYTIKYGKIDLNWFKYIYLRFMFKSEGKCCIRHVIIS